MRYRKVAVAFWVDEKVRGFSDDGRYGFLYVLTHPAMTSVGAMRATLAGLASELGWTTRRLERALEPAIKAGMVEINAAASYLALPNFLRHNAPESPNVCKAWVAALSAIPECPEREGLIARCRTYLPAGPFRQAFEEAQACQATAPNIAPRLLDLRTAAAYLGVSDWTVRDLEAAGTLRRVRIPLPNHGELRKLLFDRTDLDRLVDAWKAS